MTFPCLGVTGKGFNSLFPFQIYRRISLSNKYFRAGSSRTKEYHLAKTMMVLVMMHFIDSNSKLNYSIRFGQKILTKGIQGGFFNWASPDNVSRLALPKFAWTGPP